MLPIFGELSRGSSILAVSCQIKEGLQQRKTIHQNHRWLPWSTASSPARAQLSLPWHTQWEPGDLQAWSSWALHSETDPVWVLYNCGPCWIKSDIEAPMSEAHDTVQVPPAMPPLSPFLRTLSEGALSGNGCGPRHAGFCCLSSLKGYLPKAIFQLKALQMTAHHRAVMSPASSTQPVSRACLQVCPSSAAKAKPGPVHWHKGRTDRHRHRHSHLCQLCQLCHLCHLLLDHWDHPKKCALCLHDGTGSFSWALWQCLSLGMCFPRGLLGHLRRSLYSE